MTRDINLGQKRLLQAELDDSDSLTGNQSASAYSAENKEPGT